MFKKSFEQSAKILESLDQGSSKELIEQMNAAIDLIQTLLPTLMVISAFLIVWVILAVNLPIVKRFGIKVTKWGAFRELKIPKSILWYYLLTIVVVIIFKPNQNEYLGMALVNLSYLLQILLLLQGFSLIYFIGYEKKWPKAILVVITIFSILISPLQYIIRVLGIIDLGFDIRSYILSKKS